MHWDRQDGGRPPSRGKEGGLPFPSYPPNPGQTDTWTDLANYYPSAYVDGKNKRYILHELLDVKTRKSVDHFVLQQKICTVFAIYVI